MADAAVTARSLKAPYGRLKSFVSALETQVRSSLAGGSCFIMTEMQVPHWCVHCTLFVCLLGTEEAK